MTIAAGFRFANGLLLCADTQHTYPGAMKLNASKIMPIDFAAMGGSKLVCALSGSVPYAHMAIEHCSRAISKLKPSKMDTGTLVETIEDTIEDFHQKHVYGHPAFHLSGGPDFQLLIATWSHIDKNLSLIASNDSAITNVSGYECLGSGSFLGHYLMPRIYWHAHMPLKDVTNIAIHVLQETKDYVDSCGGQSEFLVLRDDGTMSNVAYFDISTGETISRTVRQALSRMMVVCADLDMEEGKLKEEFDYAFMAINSHRKARLAERTEREELLASLAAVRKLNLDRKVKVAAPSAGQP